RPPRSTLFPYATLFRSREVRAGDRRLLVPVEAVDPDAGAARRADRARLVVGAGRLPHAREVVRARQVEVLVDEAREDPEAARDEMRIAEHEELVLVAVRARDERHRGEPPRLLESLERIARRQDRPVAEHARVIDHAGVRHGVVREEDVARALAAEVARFLGVAHAVEPDLRRIAIAGEPVALQEAERDLARALRVTWLRRVDEVLRLGG